MNDRRIAALMDAIIPQPATPVPCPRCGRAPVIVQDSHFSRFVCRPWWRVLFGLGPCFVGPCVHEGWRDGDYALRAAAGAWNRSAIAKEEP